MAFPWLPMSVIGTAVAFYIGFKNNQAYDRIWEARKIWGSIVNSSRSWGTSVRSYVGNQFRQKTEDENELEKIHRRLIYRHIAWLYTLREQLLVPTSWEHISQNSHIAQVAARRQKRYGLGLIEEEVKKVKMDKFLSHRDLEHIEPMSNKATQLIDLQSQELMKLREVDLVDDFRHIELQKIQSDFLIFQGQCERIKKFPLPRQYASASFVFVGIFIFLLPFSMAYEFSGISPYGAWISIPFSVMIAWAFLVMELIADYSENPFEGLGNDIPMFSLCRTIEIDLREMIADDDIPKPVEAVNGVLM